MGLAGMEGRLAVDDRRRKLLLHAEASGMIHVNALRHLYPVLQQRGV